ncbi:hypothetical protein BJ508DRAFT_322501 [Ascobolus immersus RN42]|uniref:DUF1711-domain-containing protein n=1 Tax=Ascobolus immersus RN42 TaxID=1160509 RepID=A0A3N4IMU1_ASCIM|nr:hypothetical protein BJ508DRAFT_322501 [Ascobolus immersus RN42]
MPPKSAAGKGKASVPRKLIVSLKITSTKLASFPIAKSPVSSAGSHTPRKSSPLAAGAVSANDVAPSPNVEGQENTPAPSVAASVAGTDVVNGAAPAKPAPKRRAPGGAKQPGRKKQRIDGGINGGGSTTSHPKLGPKSNLGAINAHLRALDRSGTPCKRWQKRGFQLKSFTGVQWELPKWATPAVEKSLNLAENTPQMKDAKAEKGVSEKEVRKDGKEEAPKQADTPMQGAEEPKSEAAVPIVVTPPKEDMDTHMADPEPAPVAV